MSIATFSTEAAAETKQAEFLVDHLAAHLDEPYHTQTTKWSIPRLRTDGKWSISACHHSDTSGLTVIEYDADDYPAV